MIGNEKFIVSSAYLETCNNNDIRTDNCVVQNTNVKCKQHTSMGIRKTKLNSLFCNTQMIRSLEKAPRGKFQL